MLRNTLWMLATLVIAAGAIAIGDDRFTEAETQVEAATAPNESEAPAEHCEPTA